MSGKRKNRSEEQKRKRKWEWCRDTAAKFGLGNWTREEWEIDMWQWKEERSLIKSLAETYFRIEDNDPSLTYDYLIAEVELLMPTSDTTEGRIKQWWCGRVLRAIKRMMDNNNIIDGEDEYLVAEKESECFGQDVKVKIEVKLWCQKCGKALKSSPRKGVENEFIVKKCC